MDKIKNQSKIINRRASLNLDRVILVENYKNKNYYEILGINPAATKKEVKSAYRALARKYHPDVNPGNKLSETKFKEIGEAYSVLSDDNKRKHYDILNGYYKPQPKQASTSEQTKKQAKDAYTRQKQKSDQKDKSSGKTEDKSFNEVFSEFLDGIFKKSETEAPVQKPQRQAPKGQKGDDITVDISITIVEAHNGTVRKINVLRTDTCSRCNGKKYINGIPCAVCESNGEISSHKKISVKIPPNVKEGSKIKISSEGNKGINGGEDGDLFLLIHIQKHDMFTFEDLNVLCEVPITPTEAALGAEIEIPTIDGFVTMKIPPETPSGQKFRLAGQGITDSQTNKRGDQVIAAIIEIPKNLTEKEKELYRELARIRKFNPRENIVFEK